MLELLHIENIAVIQEADIQFRPGFNALTGETGAGKSIVIDAMGAVLGGRTSRDLVRTGADRAFVSAEFSQVPGDLAGLAETGAAPDEDGHLLLQRELTGDGKNLCRVNGRPVTVAQLRRIGEELLNIHGQHDGQQLLDEEQHLSYLDRFGRTEAPLGRYQAAYEAMADLQAKIRALQMDEAEKARRMDSLRFQIDELERAQLVPGEEESLTERRDLLRNGEKYLSALSGADYCLNGGEEGGGAVSPSGTRRRPLPVSARSPETWGSCTSAWNSCGVKPMTLPRSFGTSGRRSTSPRRSWTRWRAGLTCCTG